MNKKEKKTIELIQSEAVKVLDFFEKSVVEIIGNEKYITLDLLVKAKEQIIKSYKKGLAANSIESNSVMSYLETAVNTLINTSKRGTLEYVNVDDFKRSATIVKISAKAPIEEKKSVRERLKTNK